MSFLYNHRTKQPQIWTYPIFIIIAGGMFYAFYVYGIAKSDRMPPVAQNTEAERLY
jgi:hypothetical protein